MIQKVGLSLVLFTHLFLWIAEYLKYNSKELRTQEFVKAFVRHHVRIPLRWKHYFLRLTPTHKCTSPSPFLLGIKKEFWASYSLTVRNKTHHSHLHSTIWNREINIIIIIKCNINMILRCVLNILRVHWSLQMKQRNQEREWERGNGKVE